MDNAASVNEFEKFISLFSALNHSQLHEVNQKLGNTILLPSSIKYTSDKLKSQVQYTKF